MKQNISPTDSTPIASLHAATLSFGAHTVWRALDLEVQPGEFLAVLGPNGAGKSSLLKVLLGMQELHRGSAYIDGQPVRRGNPAVGYVPQQRAFDASLPLRGYDLVGLGLTGNRWGLPLYTAQTRATIEHSLNRAGAQRYAHRPIGALSGGEQQRLRIAQALIGNPRLLLCDEPLLSLDPGSQQTISKLIHRECTRGAAVVFVTHEINPILPYVDRVLYIVDGKWKVGTPGTILTSQTLSELYGAPVEVLRVGGRVVVVSDNVPAEPHHMHSEEGV